MEVALTLIILGGVVANWLTFRSLKRFQVQSTIPVLPELVDCNCRAGLEEEIKEIIFPLLDQKSDKPPVPNQVDDSYLAWKNRVETPNIAPPSPHGPPPIPEPLARPYGFSR